MERLVKFEVCGQEYPLYTDAPEEDVQEILDLVKSQIEKHSKSTTLLSAKLAVLVSLNMAGKYVKLKRDFELHKQQVEKETETILNQIERYL